MDQVARKSQRNGTPFPSWVDDHEAEACRIRRWLHCEDGIPFTYHFPLLIKRTQNGALNDIWVASSALSVADASEGANDF